jgi:sugar (pentulose or hexulose) kinase
MRGFIYGLSSNSDVYEIIKSIYEGTSYESKWILESLENVKNIKIRKINVVGGATKNIPWIKTKSNVIGKNIQCATLQEAAATGAAMIALKAAGCTLEENNANEIVEYTFDAEKSKAYQEKFETYKRVYDSLKKLNESGGL